MLRRLRNNPKKDLDWLQTGADSLAAFGADVGVLLLTIAGLLAHHEANGYGFQW